MKILEWVIEIFEGWPSPAFPLLAVSSFFYLADSSSLRQASFAPLQVWAFKNPQVIDETVAWLTVVVQTTISARSSQRKKRKRKVRTPVSCSHDGRRQKSDRRRGNLDSHSGLFYCFLLAFSSIDQDFFIADSFLSCWLHRKSIAFLFIVSFVWRGKGGWQIIRRRQKIPFFADSKYLEDFALSIKMI